MDRFFNMDGPLMQGLSKLADIVWLNILTLICCIPIVTIGAALTAEHYVVLKMVRGEEGYVTRSFFKSFKINFKQATCIWLLFLVFILMFVGDLYIFNYSGFEFPEIMRVLIYAFTIVAAMIGAYVFPVLSKFDNTVINTIKNAFKFAVISLPKTILMVIIYAVPIIVLSYSITLLSIVVLFGMAGPAYLCAMLYNGVFKKFEPSEEDGEIEDEGKKN